MREEAGRVEALLRPRVPEARWVPRVNLHVTLAFLGQTEAADAIASALSRVAAAHPACDLALGGAGAFPSPRRARVLWLGLTGGEALGALAAGVRAALEPLGFEPEDRPFSAHLTLARLKTPAVVDLSGLDVRPVPFRPDGIALMHSHPGGPAPRYQRLSLARFATPV